MERARAGKSRWGASRTVRAFTGALPHPNAAGAGLRQRSSAVGLLLLALLAALSGCGLSAARTTATVALRPLPAAAHSAPLTPPVRADYRIALANATIAHMTLDQELGQLFVVAYNGTDPGDPALADMIATQGAGGIIIYGGMNIISIPQMHALTSAMQALAPIPLIIGADEEGGGDEQLGNIFPPHLAAYEIAATGDPAVAAQQATTIAGQLTQLGINTNFAPIVDVETSDRIWTRSFGGDPQLVTQLGGAQVDAYQRNGIIATLKHFPGLGGANCNPHFCLPVVTSSRDYIEQHDFVPYRALLSHDPGMVMTTDLLMPAFDPVMPAELSQPIVTGILRDEIGYDGVVITDALYMEGISAHWSMPEAGVLSIIAGNDMLEGLAGPDQMRVMVSALRDAVTSGRLTRARIDQSVRRILLLKMQYGLFPLSLPRGQRRAGLAEVGVASPSARSGASWADAGGASPPVALVPDPRRLLTS
ncbi:MAG TPA: glycoside hydrolase family 3 N-terminal domain-containing protein [Ktedonobacterales bacterium]|nr:glycoside hydrolase family 3 N-terminal domain-containing protein [Ktedonobacterales bacterium]